MLKVGFLPVVPWFHKFSQTRWQNPHNFWFYSESFTVLVAGIPPHLSALYPIFNFFWVQELSTVCQEETKEWSPGWRWCSPMQKLPGGNLESLCADSSPNRCQSALTCAAKPPRLHVHLDTNVDSLQEKYSCFKYFTLNLGANAVLTQTCT